jgi:hypothetical protein
MNPRIDDLIALAALGELTDAEAAELDDAAILDDDVAAELSMALAAAAALQASDPQAPPASMRASVLEAIAHAEQAPADRVGARSADHAGSGSVVSIERGRRRTRFAPFLVAAAALLVIVGGAVMVTTRGGSGSDDSFAAVVDADDVSTRLLRGELGASLTVSYSSSESALVVTGDAVPQPDADQTYQLWLIDSTGATSVGVFRPDDDGRVEVRFDDTDPTGSVLGVTREPGSGSDQPTLPILASA